MTDQKNQKSDTGTDARQRILEAAGPIFAQKGFADTKVRDICSQAGVNLAAVNYYFGDKQNLYYETVAFARQSRAAENPLTETEGAPEARLRDFIGTLVNRVAGIQDPPWEVQLLMREVLFPTTACRRLIEEHFRPLFNQLLDIIEALIPDPVDEVTAYRIGCSIVSQVLYLRFTSRLNAMFLPAWMVENCYRNEQIAEHVYQFSLAAIRSPEFRDASRRESGLQQAESGLDSSVDNNR